MIRSFLLILFSFISLSLFADNDTVNICVFYNYKIKSTVFTPVGSGYLLVGDENTEYKLDDNSSLYFSAFEDKIQVSTKDKIIGIFDKVTITNLSQSGYFRVKPTIPMLESRSYDDNLIVTNSNSNLVLINKIETNKYLAGVVLAEAGPNIIAEFYKAQALISRTYMLGHTDRHIAEGFNLCDDVHCQAYHGRNNVNYKISESVELTNNIVIVDSTFDIITAAYHSNSGGLTSDSEIEWSLALPYLRSVVDTFSINQRNYSWKKIISVDEWKDFLRSINFSDKAVKQKQISISANNRNKFLVIGNDSIRMREIRKYFNLRSSYFGISQFNKSVIFNGFGYGHGVGLSQIGAMKMAHLGYNYEQIIKFYYSNVQLVSFDSYLLMKQKRDSTILTQ